MNLIDLFRMSARRQINAHIHGEHECGTQAANTCEEQNVLESEYALKHAGHRVGVLAVEASVSKRVFVPAHHGQQADHNGERPGEQQADVA